MINAKTLNYLVEKHMPKEQYANYESSGSDFFVKVTVISKIIIEHYEFKNNVKKFIDSIDHSPWYEIPFGHTPTWEKHHCYCGEIDYEAVKEIEKEIKEVK